MFTDACIHAASTLTLSDNQLSGTIPSTISGLTGLGYVCFCVQAYLCERFVPCSLTVVFVVSAIGISAGR